VTFETTMQSIKLLSATLLPKMTVFTIMTRNNAYPFWTHSCLREKLYLC